MKTMLSLCLVLVMAGQAWPQDVPPPNEGEPPYPEKTGPVSQAGGASAERSMPGPEAREKLTGWWLRHDQSYMMVLDAVGEGGKVEARYLNPGPVQVSKAEIGIEGGFIRLLLELTDRNYPGNYYELAYQPDRDMWIGLYHHLGNGETYEVYFVRFEDEKKTNTPSPSQGASAPNQR